MTHWETCICGHLKHVMTGRPILPWHEPQTPLWALDEASRYLGVSRAWAIQNLTYNASMVDTREKAIALLEELIEEEKAPMVPALVPWEQAPPALVRWTVAIEESERELACV